MDNETEKKEEPEIVKTIFKGNVVPIVGAVGGCGAAVGIVSGGGIGALIGMALVGPPGAAIGYGIGVIAGALGGATAAGVETKKVINKLTE